MGISSWYCNDDRVNCTPTKNLKHLDAENCNKRIGVLFGGGYDVKPWKNQCSVKLMLRMSIASEGTDFEEHNGFEWLN